MRSIMITLYCDVFGQIKTKQRNKQNQKNNSKNRCLLSSKFSILLQYVASEHVVSHTEPASKIASCLSPVESPKLGWQYAPHRKRDLQQSEHDCGCAHLSGGRRCRHRCRSDHASKSRYHALLSKEFSFCRKTSQQEHGSWKANVAAPGMQEKTSVLVRSSCGPLEYPMLVRRNLHHTE